MSQWLENKQWLYHAVYALAEQYDPVGQRDGSVIIDQQHRLWNTVSGYKMR